MKQLKNKMMAFINHTCCNIGYWGDNFVKILLAKTLRLYTLLASFDQDISKTGVPGLTAYIQQHYKQG